MPQQVSCGFLTVKWEDHSGLSVGELEAMKSHAERVLVGEINAERAQNALRRQKSRLVIRRGERAAFWRGTKLGINKKTEFHILAILHEGLGQVVSYATLLRAVKPKEIMDSITIIDAPPELTPAVSRIRRSLKEIGCPWKIQSLDGEGYQLLPDQ
jgi:DNA-binding response OmpR family regulator